jgi:GTP-binding protein
MRFIDCVTLHTAAGNGGPGAVSYRREKFVDKGGPAGGNGGKGGDVVFVADRNVGTLLDLRYRKSVEAQHGQGGGKLLRDGANGQDAVVLVPVGTILRDALTTEILGDLTEDGARCVIATGGRGGKGNAFFKTSTNQTPSYAQPGEPGLERTVTVEIKLLADIGIIGFPSVGKSTLISVISNAKPKIAAYPFTTLVPNLGIVGWRDHRSFVVADIPGLIEGAHEGRGLGYQFLRHVERCRALCHVVEVTPQYEGSEDGRDPIADFEAINRELALFSPELAARPQFVALAKTDLPFVQERAEALRAHFEGAGYVFFEFSAITRDGLQPLVDHMGQVVAETPAPDVTTFTMPEPDLSRVPAMDAILAAEEEALDDETLDDEALDDDEGVEVVYVRDDDA